MNVSTNLCILRFVFIMMRLHPLRMVEVLKVSCKIGGISDDGLTLYTLRIY